MSVQTTLRLDAAIRAAGIPIDGVSGSLGSVRVDYQAAATPAQITQGAAIVAAFDWSAGADATWQAQQENAVAAANLDRGAAQAGAASDRVVYALAMMVLDEFNTHSTFEAAMLSAIAASASLADLKTRMAAVNAIPARTPAQLVSAIKAKISAAGE
jgi:hypothetical protein